MDDARLRTVEDGAARRAAGVGDVEGWEIPAGYLDVPAGRAGRAARRRSCVHNEKDVRSLGLLLAHVERRLRRTRTARHEAPPGDLAGLARAYTRERRHDEALECLDEALAAAGAPVRRPVRRSPVAAAAVRGSRGRATTLVVAADAAALRRTRAGGGWRGGSRTAAADRRADAGPAPGRARGPTSGCRRAGAAAAAARALRGVPRRPGRRAAAAGGPLGRIAWIEVAKLREHRLGDRAGALAATRAAWRCSSARGVTGRAAPAARGGPRSPAGAGSRRGCGRARPGAA